ncbi:amidohydrolase [Burkholderia gladioli]|uniref:amidohydrolase family protein n=1 Tax=Burkholderia gladioli TaxID=28095 RepID=UPI001364A2D7|nr:amidohydrolase family protein [Burkholderia gladioli]KAF1057832.1 D-galactarolactone isomerase [Burkholderia gladioli]WAG22063.1 amidohydrolase [Burkholderia gladioli]
MSPVHALAGACDCHVHVYDDAYPLAPSATFVPPPAPANAYRDMQRALGLSRVVVVQPTGYGTDNRCTLAAIEQLGDGARGVAVVEPGVDDEELQRLHAGGMRGLRFMMLRGGVLGWDALTPLASRIAALGWHINLQLDGRTLPDYAALLARLPTRLVIDHLGKFLGPVAADGEAFAALCRLLDGGRCWIKLSAPYESSREGPPAYQDVAWIARELAVRYPERCLWASNWPHPNVKPVPDDAALLDWAIGNLSSSATLARILVTNPAELYGFASGDGAA